MTRPRQPRTSSHPIYTRMQLPVLVMLYPLHDLHTENDKQSLNAPISYKKLKHFANVTQIGKYNLITLMCLKSKSFQL